VSIKNLPGRKQEEFTRRVCEREGGWFGVKPDPNSRDEKKTGFNGPQGQRKEHGGGEWGEAQELGWFCWESEVENTYGSEWGENTAVHTFGAFVRARKRHYLKKSAKWD